MEKPIVIANWKMNKNAAESREWLSFLKADLKEAEREKIDVVVCPPFTLLTEMSRSDASVVWGAQNLHGEDQGPFTGEISGGMLREAGCQYVIVGHSERRWKMGETDEMIHQKLQAAWRHRLTPILCVGEQAREKSENKTERVLLDQLCFALRDFVKNQIESLIIAYEPVWAIGTGTVGSRPAATPADVRSAYAIIKQCLGQYNLTARIIYGGSVDSKNVASFFPLDDNQGFLVGGASLKPLEFGSIIKQTLKNYAGN